MARNPPVVAETRQNLKIPEGRPSVLGVALLEWNESVPGEIAAYPELTSPEPLERLFRIGFPQACFMQVSGRFAPRVHPLRAAATVDGIAFHQGCPVCARC